MGRIVLIVLVNLFALAACADRAEIAEYDRKYLDTHLTYYHDKTTGLCFAANNLQYNNATLTNVPCTEAVMARCAFIGTFTKPER